jgi:uncharacterized membrane protein
MAGIGFDLRKIFYTEKGIRKAKVSFQSIFITSGPWIISIFTIVALKIINETIMTKSEFNTLISVFVYLFVFSNILSSPVTNLVTRHVSDLIYKEKPDEILSSFLTGFILIGAISFLISYLFLMYFTNLQKYALEISYLFSSLNILWFVMIFVTMLKKPKKVFNAFLFGIIVVVLLNIFYAKGVLIKSLNSFTIGICLTIYFLISLIYEQFKFNNKISFKWLLNVKYYPLVFSGFFLYLGMWSDKLVYWFFSDKSVNLIKGFYCYPAYDFATFLAFLTIIPTTAYFVIFIETDFHKSQRTFLNLLEQNKSLYQIKRFEEELMLKFYKSLLNIFCFQFAIAIIFMFLSIYFLEHFNILSDSLPFLKIATMCASFQMIFNVIVIFFYYYDFQKEATLITFLFFLLNATFTYFVKNLPFEYTGYSYFFSLIISILLGFFVAKYKLSKVTYYILMASS